jgi:poly-gamma-glutamate capsule biosynthesis protein CapA/YwtB (metallophosphatase superfamily)
MRKNILLLSITFTIVIGGFYLLSKPQTFSDSFISPIDHYFKATEPTPSTTPKTTILFTGDVMLGRTTEITTREQKDFHYPFLKVADILKQADLTFVNLENPITKDCKPFTSGFVFCANPEMLEGLTFAGIDMVTLANNHTMNHGNDGIDQTVQFLDEKGIAHTGLNNLAVKQLNNVSFGFLGFNKAQESNPQLTANEKQLLIDSDKKVDVLIVAMHWGVEYQDKALPGVRRLGKELVELGADVVVGSHPHWVQDVEYLNGEGSVVARRNAVQVMIKQDKKESLPIDNAIPIYYSLGNFVFDQMWSEGTRKGLAIKLTFDGTKIEKEEFLPVYIRERGQPEWVQ